MKVMSMRCDTAEGDLATLTEGTDLADAGGHAGQNDLAGLQRAAARRQIASEDCNAPIGLRHRQRPTPRRPPRRRPATSRSALQFWVPPVDELRPEHRAGIVAVIARRPPAARWRWCLQRARRDLGAGV